MISILTSINAPYIPRYCRQSYNGTTLDEKIKKILIGILSYTDLLLVEAFYSE